MTKRLTVSADRGGSLSLPMTSVSQVSHRKVAGLDEQYDVFAETCALEPDIEVDKPLRGDVHESCKKYQTKELGSPHRSRRLEAVSRIDLYVVTPHLARAHVASALVGIDEENFLVIENRAARSGGGWYIPTLPKPAHFRREGRSGRILVLCRDGSQGKWRKPRARLRALGSCDSGSGFARGQGKTRQEARYPNNFWHSSLMKLSKTGM